MQQDARNLRIARRPNDPPIQPETATPIEPLLTPADVARILGVSKRFLERSRSAGTFPAPDVWLGRLPRYRPQTVRDFIAKGGVK
jgi:hypothetical protein